jgi:small subunit ribosomal protein S14
MAKKSSIEKNERRKRMTLQYAAKRKSYKGVVRDPKATDAEKRAAQLALQKLPRNSAPERVRNRCSMTGRARGYVKMFGLSRIAFREMALMGLIPGVRKASW